MRILATSKWNRSRVTVLATRCVTLPDCSGLRTEASPLVGAVKSPPASVDAGTVSLISWWLKLKGRTGVNVSVIGLPLTTPAILTMACRSTW